LFDALAVDAPAGGVKAAVALAREAADKFETRSLYDTFLDGLCLAFSVRTAGLAVVETLAARDALAAACEQSRIAVDGYNQQIELALEALAVRLINDWRRVVL
jgi:hypothetical protein